MHGRDGGQDPDLGGGYAAQVLDVPGVGGAHLEDEDLGAGVGGEDGEGEPDLVVQVSGGGRDALSRVPEDGREGVLGRGLSDRTGDADDGGRSGVRANERPPRELLQRLYGVVHDEGRHV